LLIKKKLRNLTPKELKMKTLTIIAVLLISGVSFGQITLPKKITKKEVQKVPAVKKKVNTPKTKAVPAPAATERKRPGAHSTERKRPGQVTNGKTTKPAPTPVTKPKKPAGRL
jgi:hypothetical protein